MPAQKHLIGVKLEIISDLWPRSNTVYSLLSMFMAVSVHLTLVVIWIVIQP